MWRELIITDVTRMGGDKVCVAGVDHQGNCIRPLLAYPNPIRESDLYDGDTVMIRPRAVVNMFLEPEPECSAPHVEDHLWLNPNQIEVLRLADDKIWRGVLERTASESVAAIFEAPIHKNKKVAPGLGTRSLGTIKPSFIKTFSYHSLRFIEENEKYEYRLTFTDAGGDSYAQLPITDLSLRYYVDYLRVQGGLYPKKIRAILAKNFEESEVFLRLGLTRPFQKSDEDDEWCYLQVNGIYTFPDYLEGRCFADFAP